MTPIAVITGASRGIGAATARRLAADGADIAVGYRTDEPSAVEVVAACEAMGRRAVAIPVEVGSEPDVERLFRTVDDALGPVTVLVNNAGVVDTSTRVEDLRGSQLEAMWATNITGPFLCAREALQRMSTRHGGPGGVIINVSSAASRHGSPGEYVHYAASKGAIDTFTLGLAKEVAGEGVRVNAVRPGIIDTEIHASGGQPDRARTLSPQIPMGRPGEADEVAAAIAWLCSADATYVTGAILDVAGGR